MESNNLFKVTNQNGNTFLARSLPEISLRSLRPDLHEVSKLLEWQFTEVYFSTKGGTTYKIECDSEGWVIRCSNITIELSDELMYNTSIEVGEILFLNKRKTQPVTEILAVVGNKNDPSVISAPEAEIVKKFKAQNK